MLAVPRAEAEAWREVPSGGGEQHAPIYESMEALLSIESPAFVAQFGGGLMAALGALAAQQAAAMGDDGEEEAREEQK